MKAPLIRRYVLLRFLSVLGVASFGLSLLHLTTDIVERMDDVVEAGLPAARGLVFFACGLPTVLVRVLPAAVLAAGLFMFGQLSRDRELTAMHLAGIPAAIVTRPVLLACAMLAILHFLFAEWVARPSQALHARILKNEIKGHTVSTRGHRVAWWMGGSRLVRAHSVTREGRRLRDVVIYTLGKDGIPVHRANAEALDWSGNAWRATNAGHRVLGRRGTGPDPWESRIPPIRATPRTFRYAGLPVEELPFDRLWVQIRDWRNMGLSATAARVELHSRLAAAAACLLMAWLALPLGRHIGSSGSMARSFGLAVVLLFVYVLALRFGGALALAGVLPPAVGVWTGSLVFGTAGVYFRCTAPD